MFLLLGEIPWPLVSLGLVGVSVTTMKYDVDLKQIEASKKEPHQPPKADGRDPDGAVRLDHLS